MAFKSHKLAAFLVMGVFVVPGSAQAQWYSSYPASPPPLYPYAVQNRQAVNTDRTYAIEVAPGTYVIKRPNDTSARPPARARQATRANSAPPAKLRPPKNDPALIEELRQRGNPKHDVVNTKKIVRKKPIVVETTRYVDLPPRVVERYTVVDDTQPGPGKNIAVDVPPSQANGMVPGGKRVIEADAEITILGADRMTIQLYRKGGRGKPQARIN